MPRPCSINCPHYRRNTPVVASKGIAHLFTGRPSENNTIGIARLGGVCDVERGVSLTFEQNGSSTIDALIMAHEIAHNLGADHDTEECGSYLLMWPEFNMSQTLSQCALDAMRPVIQQARNACLTSPLYADAAIAIDTTGPEKINGEPFTFAVIPRSVGTVALNQVTVNVNVSQFYTVHSASVAGGNCSFAPMHVNCTLPTLAAGAEPRIEINATSPFANSSDVSANDHSGKRPLSRQQHGAGQRAAAGGGGRRDRHQRQHDGGDFGRAHRFHHHSHLATRAPG